MISEFFFNRKRNILMKEKDMMDKEETSSGEKNVTLYQIQSRTCIQ